MLPYWLLFGYFAIAATLVAPKTPDGRTPGYIFLIFGALCIALMIGLRFQVGADWFAYQRIFAFAGRASLERLLNFGDPGYQLLNWLAQQLNLKIWVVNMVGALVFTWGLVRLSIAQPYPWLGMLTAIPYMVVVVAMGYSRQALALGFIMAGLASISRGGSLLKFVAYVAVAGLFHRTAIIVVPLAAFVTKRSKGLNILLIAMIFPLLFYSLLSSHVDQLIRNYVTVAYSSSGAAIRISLCFIPAVLYFLFRNRMKFNEEELVLWRNFALAAVLALILLLTTPSSTAVDRLAIYLLPLQIAVYARLPFLLRSEIAAKGIVVTSGALILFVWLNYADNSISWQNYRFFSPFD